MCIPFVSCVWGVTHKEKRRHGTVKKSLQIINEEWLTEAIYREKNHGWKVKKSKRGIVRVRKFH